MKKLFVMIIMMLVMVMLLAGCGQSKEFDYYCSTQYVIDVFGNDLEAFERKLNEVGIKYSYSDEMGGYIYHFKDNNTFNDVLFHRR